MHTVRNKLSNSVIILIFADTLIVKKQYNDEVIKCTFYYDLAYTYIQHYMNKSIIFRRRNFFVFLRCD